MSVSDERLAELIGLGCDGIARHEACALATEVQGFRAAAKVRAIREGDGEAKRWLIEEQITGGAVRWQCVEHEHNANAIAAGSPYLTFVTPLYAATPVATGGRGGMSEPECDLCGDKPVVGDIVVCDGCGRAYLTPTDNLEAGAGDLVARLLKQATTLEAAYGWTGDIEEAAAQLSAVTAERDYWRDTAHEQNGLAFGHEERATAAEAENARLREALTMARDEYGFDMNDEQLSLIEAALSQEAPK